MKYAIKPSLLTKSINIPSSKSQSIRAILFGSLAQGTTVIKNALNSPDIEAMIKACGTLGAQIKKESQAIQIEGIAGVPLIKESTINVGNSGLVLRFIAGIASLGQKPIIITGDHSICHQRPMGPMLQALNQLGVKADSLKNNNFAPIKIQGPLTKYKAHLNGEDSQPISSLLIAGALNNKTLSLNIDNPGEKPWIDVTLNWLKRLGVKVEHDNYSNYTVTPSQPWKGFNYKVPGDWSSAAFPIAAALVTNSEIDILNLDKNDPQGDKKLIDILKKMGANIIERHTTYKIMSGQQLKGINIDLNDCIDAITILSVIACFAKGKTQIRNAAVARNKECNRIACITSELKKMGAKISETNDGIIIEESPLKGTHVHSFGDHRMAMSLAVAGLGAKGNTLVDDVSCVKKTYPTFADDLKKLGANLEVLS